MSGDRRYMGKLFRRPSLIAALPLGIVVLGCTGNLSGPGSGPAASNPNNPNAVVDPNNPNPVVDPNNPNPVVDPNNPNPVVDPNNPNPVVQPTEPFTPGNTFDWFDDTKVP